MYCAIRFVPVTLLLALLAAGCGGGDRPDLGRVSGTVKLGGEPLENAEVMFVPSGGRPSMGVTNSNGHYELEYTVDAKGAVVGTHTVTISTYREAGEDDEGKPVPGAPEKVPAR